MANRSKNTTPSSSKKIDQLVSRVNSYRRKCENITSDDHLVDVDYYGSLTRMSLEKSVFVSKTNEFRNRLRNGESIENIMPEALALVREATKRVLNMEPYDVQIEAAIAMIGDKIGKDDNGLDIHQRVIAEMKTGEGKTLVQISVAYLNVLEATKDKDPRKWTNVHVMTSNDALARRDATANGKVFDLLGITCGFVPSRRSVKDATPAERSIYKHNKQLSYMCDVVYAMPSTIAFDYLDDNVALFPRDRNITRGLSYAIVDEADDVLIDQAINPLKLSGSLNSTDAYGKYLEERDEEKRAAYKWATDFLYGVNGARSKPVSRRIYNRKPFQKKGVDEDVDYVYVKNTRDVMLSDRILDEISNSTEDDALYGLRYAAFLDCIKVKEGFSNGVDYKVDYDKENGTAEVVLIDQNIGRKRYSNKYTNGIQEAIEAKEEYLEQDSPTAKKRYHIEFTKTHSTKALCTYPDFLNLYTRSVCGMTGTSDEKEFQELYGFQTYRVKTRKRNIRIDEKDELYATMKEKLNAIVEKVVECNQKGIPVLIGTTSLNESKLVSSMLENRSIRHKVLNADNEEEENEIISGAGLYGSVTVATNMAGRGTDIKLGDGVRELGGLYVIGTSKNKSGRIDLQLRGRSGRQGDPGKTKYYYSLEDDLIKEHYKSNELKGVIELLKGTNKPIHNKLVIRTANKCQELKEIQDTVARHDTTNLHQLFVEHRKIVYKLRNKILDADSINFVKFIKSIIVYYIDFIIKGHDLDFIKSVIGHIADVDKCFSKNKKEFKQNLINDIYGRFRANFSKEDVSAEEIIKYIFKVKPNILRVIDTYWVEHVHYLEYQRSTLGVGIVNDPVKKYEYEANETFAHNLMPAIYNEIISYAVNPNLKFGDYQINYPEEKEESEEAQLK